MCTQKLTNSQIIVCHSAPQNQQTKRVPVMKKTKKQDAEKKLYSHKVRGVSPEAGRKSMMGKICGRCGF